MYFYLILKCCGVSSHTNNKFASYTITEPLTIYMNIQQRSAYTTECLMSLLSTLTLLDVLVIHPYFTASPQSPSSLLTIYTYCCGVQPPLISGHLVHIW